MTNYAPPPPRKSKRGLFIALGFLAAAVILLCCAGAVSKMSGGDSKDALLTVPATETTFSAGAGVVPTSEPAAARLSARDLKISPKIKSKQCFGSAGCLLEYSVNLTLTSSARIASDDCEVTYEVGGFKDGAQVHTLTLHRDGTFEQDAYQSGDTSGSSRKLTTKITDVTC